MFDRYEVKPTKPEIKDTETTNKKRKILADLTLESFWPQNEYSPWNAPHYDSWFSNSDSVFDLSFNPKPNKEQFIKLNELIKKDNASEFEKYVRYQDFASSNFFYKNILYFSAWNGSLNMVKHILKEKVNLKVFASEWRRFFSSSGIFTLFRLAIDGRNVEFIKFIYEFFQAESTFLKDLETARDQIIVDAATIGDAAIVAYLISIGAKVNYPLYKILNAAVLSGEYTVVKLLTDAGAKIEEDTLEIALKQGTLEIVQYILQIKPDLTQHKLTKPPTVLAAESGSIALQRFLEEQKMDDTVKADAQTQDLDTMLIAAASSKGNFPLLDHLLIDKGLLAKSEKTGKKRLYFETILSNARKTFFFTDPAVDMKDKYKMIHYLSQTYSQK